MISPRICINYAQLTESDVCLPNKECRTFWLLVEGEVKGFIYP